MILRKPHAIVLKQHVLLTALGAIVMQQGAAPYEV